MHYKILFRTDDDSEWELYAKTEDYELAWERWNNCCDANPYYEVKIIKEEVLRQVKPSLR